jgi:hypothetical protein
MGFARKDAQATRSAPAQPPEIILAAQAFIHEEEEMKIKKLMLLYGVSMIVGLYTTFVLTVLWNWFVVPAFHLSAVSFWAMYGLTLVVSLFQSPRGDIDAEQRHKIVAVMLDACVPVERREEVAEQLQEFAEQIWYEAGWQVVGRIVTSSVTLGVAFVAHGLAS